MDKKNPWRTLSSRVVFDTSYYSVREDSVIRPDGKEGKYFVIEAPASVFIVPMTEENEVCLVGLFRYTTNMFSWEVPAGAVEGKDVFEDAKRELLEETGLVAEEWAPLGTLQPFNGRSSCLQHVFLARNTRRTHGENRQEEGIENVIQRPFREVLEMIRSGEITDSESISAIMLAGLHLNLI